MSKADTRYAPPRQPRAGLWRSWLAGMPALALLGLAGCAVLSFDSLTVDTLPSQAGQVLAAGTGVRVGFSREIDRLSAEAAFRVAAVGQTVSGDLRWEGNVLCFQPVPALLPGRRYVLSLNGPVKGRDGQSYPLARSVEFYSVSADLPPVLKSWEPREGGTCAASGPLRLVFDRPMDGQSFAAAFVLSPADEFDLEWSADATTVAVKPRSAWKSGIVYGWQLGTECRDRTGIRLDQAVGHLFVSEATASAPEIGGVAVAARVAAGPGLDRWLDISTDLSQLKPGDAIRFGFSRPLDPDSVEQAFRIQPPLKGHFLWLGPVDLLWLPDADWTPEGSYAVSWSTALKDRDGSALKTAWRRDFRLDLTWLEVTRLDFDRGDGSPVQTVSGFNRPEAVAVFAPRPPENSGRFILSFNRDLGNADRSQFASLVSCSRFFPDLASVFSPSLYSVSFPAANQVCLAFTGFSIGPVASGGVPAMPCRYRLSLAGGPGGIRLAAGPYLREDTWLVFATN